MHDTGIRRPASFVCGVDEEGASGEARFRVERSHGPSRTARRGVQDVARAMQWIVGLAVLAAIGIPVSVLVEE